MRYLILLGIIFLGFNSFAQFDFNTAYSNSQFVPEGLLEGVAWNNTRIKHLENFQPSCSGLPQAFGVMGLISDGQNYFKQNAQTIAALSGISINDQILSGDAQILAYALAYDQVVLSKNLDPNADSTIREVIHALSEIPDTGYVNLLAKDMQVYGVMTFMASNKKALEFDFTPSHFNLSTIFGADNYAVLSSEKIIFSPTGIKSKEGHTFSLDEQKSLQYGPAIWNPAPSCNFSSRNGVAVSAITIHTIQGTYAGAISWAQNCSSNVSYHYVIRSSDGQVTQMVLEEDKGWHVGSENPYTIGYEHEGYVDNPVWYTTEMYESSADLSRDIVNSGYGIPPLRTFYGAATVGTNTLGACTKIKGHQHYPNQTHTDPGVNWDWERYYQLINNTYTPNIITNPTGNLYDTGGPSADYQDDEREFWLIEPSNAASINLDFSVFNVELDYDFLFIYDGDSINAPLIGVYTGSNSPGSITSTGGSLLIEFRSDCSTLSNGWEASYTTTLFDVTSPTTDVVIGQTWYTDDFNVTFDDIDTQSGIMERYYLVAESTNSNSDWFSNGQFSFAHETFEDNNNNWTDVTGTYTLSNGELTFNDVNEQNSNSYITVAQNNSNTYLYEWDQTITSLENDQRAGLHFFCDDASLPNRGNSYFVYLRESDNEVQIFSVDNDVFTLQNTSTVAINQGQQYNCKTTYNPNNGWIHVYVDDSLVGEWQDITPLTTGTSVSFRTGGCEAAFDNLNIYHSRSTSALITSGSNDEMSIESVGGISTGMIKTVVLDSAYNWSDSDLEYYLLDFTPPTVNYLSDGPGNDIDTFYTTTIEANWGCEDIHSGIGSYDYAIGTLPTLDNIAPWSSNGLTASINSLLNSPTYGQVYHVSIRATNGAGLVDQFTSNGQVYLEGLSLIENELENISIYPNPVSDEMTINSTERISVNISDLNGKIVYEGDEKIIDVRLFAEGKYNVMISIYDSFIIKPIIIVH